MPRPASFAVVAVLTAAPAFAAFTPPAYVTGPTPLATAAAQTRSYQSWNVFAGPKGPNAPDVYDVNPYGTADAFDGSTLPVGSGVFVTSGGNIYSPVGVIKPRLVVPLANVGGNFETVVVEIQIGLGSATITPQDFTVNGRTPDQLAGYFFQDNTAGQVQQYTYGFVLPDTQTLRMDFGWNAASASLDRVSVNAVSSAVPEPAGLAVLGLGAAGLLRRR